jgi:hypothetical protein
MNYNTNENIMKRVQEHYNYIKDKYEVVAIFLQGSQNYKLDVYNDDYQSDVDTKAIILPTFNEFILGKEPISETLVLDNQEHIDLKDIRVMFTMFKKANISYIELLFTDFYIVNPKYQEILDELRSIRDDIIDYPRLIKACYGMTLEKRKALCHPYPTIKWKIDKYGFDGKQLSHLMRLFFLLTDLDESGVLTKETFYPKEEFREDLIAVKENKTEASLEKTIETADNFCEWTKELADSMLEEEWIEPNTELLDNLLIKTLRQYFKEDILKGE